VAPLRRGALGRRTSSRPGLRAASPPKPCTTGWDFILLRTASYLKGIASNGTDEAGSAGRATARRGDPRSAVGASYLIQKQNSRPLWSLHQRLDQFIHWNQRTEPIRRERSLLSFALDAGFDPYFLCDSPMDRDRLLRRRHPQKTWATAYSDSAEAGRGSMAKVMSASVLRPYGTLTVFPTESLTWALSGRTIRSASSYALTHRLFGITCGGGNTENCRNSTSLKYRINVGQFRAAALWQFGGYAQNKPPWSIPVPSRRRYLNVGQGCSRLTRFTAMSDSVSLALAPGRKTPVGCDTPVLTDAHSDDLRHEAVMLC